MLMHLRNVGAMLAINARGKWTIESTHYIKNHYFYKLKSKNNSLSPLIPLQSDVLLLLRR